MILARSGIGRFSKMVLRTDITVSLVIENAIMGELSQNRYFYHCTRVIITEPARVLRNIEKIQVRRLLLRYPDALDRSTVI
jgi:hypothetical protein